MTTSEEKEVKKSAAKQAKPKRTSEKKTDPMIYIGPNLSNGVLSRFTVFKDGVPEHIADPEVSRLIVPVQKLGDALVRLSQSGTAEHSTYHKLSRKEVK